jgi:hypothetical protein
VNFADVPNRRPPPLDRRGYHHLLVNGRHGKSAFV